MGIYKGQTPKDITDQVFGPLKSTTGTVHDFTPHHVFTMFYRQCKSSLQYKSLYKNLSTSCGRSNSTIHLFNPDSLINYSALLQRFNPHNTFYSTVLYLKLMFTKSPQMGVLHKYGLDMTKIIKLMKINRRKFRKNVAYENK